ncbi:MAG: hypothetical protein HYX52_07055 [Chloroflexi bacterium]|nr:hypothetical protein [Chloroflexota bacterium]
MAIMFLVLMATEVNFNLLFSYNLIRGWHWLALFGSMYYISGPLTRRKAVLVMVLVTIAFLIGYDFLAFVIIGCLATVLALPPLSHRLPRLKLVVAATLLPLVLRQIQIIGALGADFWILDLYYSAVIKTSFLNSALPLPPLDQIDLWYASRHVERPFATPENNVGIILSGAWSEFAQGWIPQLGYGTMAVATVGLLLAGVTFVLALRAAPGDARRASLHPAGAVLLLAAVVAAGLYFFAPLSVQIYLGHRFPMVIAPILLAYAYVGSAAWAVIRWSLKRGTGSWGIPRILTPIAAACLVLLLLVRVEALTTSVRELNLAPAEKVRTIH